MRQMIFSLLIACCLLVLSAGCGDSCKQEDSNACSTDYSTCNATCVADQACLDSCQQKFCACMDDIGCDPPSSCSTAGI